MTGTRPPTDPPRQKQTLFCPDCDYENGLNGDWLRPRSDGTLVCPDCGAVVVSQPRFAVPA